MPTYDYRCPDGHEFEQFTRKISDAQSALPCPTCGKTAARRVSAGGGLLFKGSGFYITDYGKDGKKDQRAASKTDAAVSTSTNTSGSSSATGSGSSSSTSGGTNSGAPSGASPAPSSPTPKSGTDK